MNIEKLYESARKNVPLSVQEPLFPIPDKHLANTSLDRIHTTRRAQVLSQNIAEEFIPNKSNGPAPMLERVFQRSNPKPIEMTTTFPEQLINSDNSYDLFLKHDPKR